MTNEWTSFRIAGYEVKVLEVGDIVSVFDSGMSPIRVKDSEACFYPYEARRVAELLVRSDAKELAEQLLRAAEIADALQERRGSPD